MAHTFTLAGRALCAALLFGSAAGPAAAQSFPDGGVSVIVPFGAGGQTDIASRLIAEAMASELDATVTVVNRAGAGGTVGSAEVAAAEADGYTLGVITSTPLVQAPNLRELPYSADSFDYVCRVYNNPMIFAVAADSELSSPQDLVEYAQSERLRYGSSGPGAVQHLGMLQFTGLAGIEGVHVANTGDAENIRNILAGVITGTLVPASVIRSNADSIKPIGVMDSERLDAFPDVPTFAEAGYDVLAAVWGVLAGPDGLPEDALGTLREACAAAQATEAFAARVAELGMEPAFLDGAATEAFVGSQDEVAASLLEELGLAE